MFATFAVCSVKSTAWEAHCVDRIFDIFDVFDTYRYIIMYIYIYIVCNISDISALFNKARSTSLARHLSETSDGF